MILMSRVPSLATLVVGCSMTWRHNSRTVRSSSACRLVEMKSRPVTSPFPRRSSFFFSSSCSHWVKRKPSRCATAPTSTGSLLASKGLDGDGGAVPARVRLLEDTRRMLGADDRVLRWRLAVPREIHLRRHDSSAGALTKDVIPHKQE